VLYAQVANKDHRSAFHFFPDDIAHFVTFPKLEEMWYQRRFVFDIDYTDTSKHSGSENDEYCVVENQALPFYLEQCFDRDELSEKNECKQAIQFVPPARANGNSNVYNIKDKSAELKKLRQELVRAENIERNTQRLFRLELAQSQHIEELVWRWSDLRHARPDLFEDENGARSAAENFFREWRSPQNMSSRHLACLMRAWYHMLDSDILIIPSVLLLDKKYTANEWYTMLRQLEQDLAIRIYPFIDVESQMENKDKYMHALMKDPMPYTPLEKKIQLARQATPQHFQTPSTDEPQEHVSSAGTSPSHAGEVVDSHTRHDVQIIYRAHSGTFAPTFMIPNFKQASKLPDDELIGIVEEFLGKLRREIDEAEWKVEPGVFIVKGTNSTRTNVYKRCMDAESIVKIMREASVTGMRLVRGISCSLRDARRIVLDSHRLRREGCTYPSIIFLGCACACACVICLCSPYRQCAPQPGFIIQPFMKGLAWESRTYFKHGQYLFTLLNEQVMDRNVTVAFATLEARGDDRISQVHVGPCEPFLVDYCAHILHLCERHCSLVSKTPIVRVDCGAEFYHCEPNEVGARTEDEIMQHRLKPGQWQRTGSGRIVRYFVNEVTTSLDINWFSGQTNFPILYTAAAATAQHLCQLAQDINKMSPGLKPRRKSDGARLMNDEIELSEEQKADEKQRSKAEKEQEMMKLALKEYNARHGIPDEMNSMEYGDSPDSSASRRSGRRHSRRAGNRHQPRRRTGSSGSSRTSGRRAHTRDRTRIGQGAAPTLVCKDEGGDESDVERLLKHEQQRVSGSAEEDDDGEGDREENADGGGIGARVSRRHSGRQRNAHTIVRSHFASSTSSPTSERDPTQPELQAHRHRHRHATMSAESPSRSLSSHSRPVKATNKPTADLPRSHTSSLSNFTQTRTQDLHLPSHSDGSAHSFPSLLRLPSPSTLLTHIHQFMLADGETGDFESVSSSPDDDDDESFVGYPPVADMMLQAPDSSGEWQTIRHFPLIQQHTRTIAIRRRNEHEPDGQDDC